jgi:hypothetical protein
MWRWLERRSRLRRARNYLRLYPRDEPAVRGLLAALDSLHPKNARDAAEIANGRELSEAEWLHTQTDGRGLGMRSHCRTKSQIGDWAARPADVARRAAPRKRRLHKLILWSTGYWYRRGPGCLWAMAGFALGTLAIPPLVQERNTGKRKPRQSNSRMSSQPRGLASYSASLSGWTCCCCWNASLPLCPASK